MILTVGLFVRLYRLGELPNGLFCDEAANGYDAYSLLETGKSLDGESWPFLFNHHGIDWVEPLYTYG
ncbi:MAG: 4-amino-4-deoxy-L-arabinose transferase, partial [Acidobacteriota bacterium]|nr:4-amino-4-deoxy-L-arabinose transferase [Acidobacteriota bacterium]